MLGDARLHLQKPDCPNWMLRGKLRCTPVSNAQMYGMP